MSWTAAIPIIIAAAETAYSLIDSAVSENKAKKQNTPDLTRSLSGTLMDIENKRKQIGYGSDPYSQSARAAVNQRGVDVTAQRAGMASNAQQAQALTNLTGLEQGRMLSQVLAKQSDREGYYTNLGANLLTNSAQSQMNALMWNKLQTQREASESGKTGAANLFGLAANVPWDEWFNKKDNQSTIETATPENKVTVPVGSTTGAENVNTSSSIIGSPEPSSGVQVSLSDMLLKT